MDYYQQQNKNCFSYARAFSAFTLMVGRQEEHLACKEIEL